MRKILTRLVSLARGNIAVAALVATILSFALPASAYDNFNPSNTYIIDGSSCTWVENYGDVVRISEDNGNSWILPTRVVAGVYAYTPTKSVSTIKIGRTNDDNNKIDYSCPDNKGAYAYIKINASFNGVTSHDPVRVAGAFITDSDWGNNPRFMSWSPDKKAFCYAAASAGDCMVSTNETFWNGRLKLKGDSNVIPSSKPTDANLESGGSSGDLNLPAAGTVYFVPWENKIWYESGTNPLDRKIYIYGNVKQDGTYSDKTNGILLEKNADGKYEQTVTIYKDNSNSFGYFRFWDDDNNKVWSSNSNADVNLSGTNTNVDKTSDANTNWKAALGKYTVVLDPDNWTFTFRQEVAGEKLYYFTSTGGAWTSGGTEITLNDSFEIYSTQGSYFIFGASAGLNWDGGNLYGCNTDKGLDVTPADGATTDGTGTYGQKEAFKLAAGAYVVTVTGYDRQNNVQFSVKKKETPTDLYVFSTRSGEWNNESGTAVKLVKGQTIGFESTNTIYFVFGPTQTFSWDSGYDKSQLYGAEFTYVVEEGTPRTAHFGNSNTFHIGSGKWELTVDDFVAGESVTFSVKRLGDADPDDNSYMEYALLGENGNVVLPLIWNAAEGYYESTGDIPTLSAGNRGNKYRVGAKKKSSTTFDVFGCANGVAYVQAGANSVDLAKDKEAMVLNCAKEHSVRLYVRDGRYSEPLRVAFIETQNLENAGKVYLLGQFLNDDYESPAWELKKQSDGTYFLDEFAMRKNPVGNDDFTHLQIAVYDENANREVRTVKREGFLIPRNVYDRQPGRLCTATLSADMQTVTLTEKMRDDGAASSVMPYIGIVGKNFRQSRNYTTRHNYVKNNEERMGHTDDGWQEAYVEYGQFGSPLLDADGNAYYNTVWPPRNNILMQSYIGSDVDPLNISSDDLTMRRDSRGILTGKEWREKLQQENPDAYKTASGNVSNGTDNAGFQLVDDRKYARYVVENVWMMGEYKIWTGFGGKKADFGADWNRFRYWGPGGDTDNAAYNQRKDINRTFVLNGETNNFHTEKISNGYAREYYRTMEFFIPLDNNGVDYVYLSSDGNVDWQPRFYLTEADGGAKIDAVARENRYVGYAPTLSSMPSGYHVADYTVTRYAYDANTDRENWLPCDKKRQAVDAATAKVAGEKFENSDIDTDGKFNNKFTKNFPKSKEDLTLYDGVYTDDNTVGAAEEEQYAPGRYIFRMQVTFTNAAGEKKTADVWSPYVEIVEETGAVHIYNAQLVKLPEGRDFLKEYQYVTYQPERTRFNRVAVQVGADGQPTELARQESPEMIEKLHEVYVNTGEWTNKTLLLTEDPTNFVGNIETFEFIKNEAGAKGFDLTSEDAPKIRNWYAYIHDNEADVNTTPEFDVNFKGTVLFENGNSTNFDVDRTASTVYQPYFMLPWLGTPVPDVKSHDNSANDSETEAWFSGFPTAYTATHEHLNRNVTSGNPGMQADMASSHHELTVTVPVVMPNILVADGNTELKEAVYNAISLQINGNSVSIEDVTGTDRGDYALVYRHQSPYDWMTYENGEWKAAKKEWTIQAAYDTENSKILAAKGVEDRSWAVEDDWTAEASVESSFEAPVIDYDTFAFEGQVEKSDKAGYDYVYTARITGANSEILAPADVMAGCQLNVLGKSPNNTYLCRTRGEGYAENEASHYGKVVNGMSPSIVLGKFYYNDDPSDKGSWSVSAQSKVKAWLKSLKVDFGRAYCFYGGENNRPSSGYKGFTGNFPNLRSDIAAAPAGAPRADTSAVTSDSEPSHSGTSVSLAEGDNAFLFVPRYATLDLNGAPGIETAVENIGVDVTGIEAGRGYIDLLGNEGSIYAADGRMVYAGSARAELTQGVYMVTLGNRTVKVLVK